MWTLASCIDRHGALPPRDAAGWVVRAAAGLVALHQRGEIHARLCADAVHVAEIPCDEVGYLAGPGDLTDEVAYHSPERLRDGKSSGEDDVWALGVLFFQCLTGKLPYPGTTRQQVAVSILRKPIAALAKETVDNLALRSVIGAVLARDREQRVRTPQDLRARLVEVFPDLARLRPLGIGEPLEGAAPAAARDDHGDEDDDDDDAGLATALFQDEPAFLRARMVAAQKRGVDTSAALQSLEAGQSVPVPAQPAVETPAPRPMPLPRAPFGGSHAVPTGSQLGPGRYPAGPPPAPSGYDAPPGPQPAFEIEDAPTVEAGSRLRTSTGSAEPAPAGQDQPVFNPDAVFGTPAAFGPPVAPATADWAAVDELPLVNVGQRPAEEPVAAIVEAITARPRAPVPAVPLDEEPDDLEPRHENPAAEEPSPPPVAAPAPRAEPLGTPATAPAPLGPAQARPIAVTATAAVLEASELDQAPRSSLLRDLLLVALLTIIGGVIGFVFLGKMWAKDTPPPAPTTAPPAVPSSANAAPGAVTPAPLAPTTPAPTSEPSAAPTGAAAGAGTAGQRSGGELSACLASTFAAGTFPTPPPSLDFICSETDAYKGGVNIRVKVIRAGGGASGVTEGMREWSMLGWYEMAAFVAIRGACCDGAPPLKTQPGIDMCPLDAKLEGLAKAVRGADDAGMDEAVKEFGGMLRCLVAAGVSRTFGQPGAPDPGAVTVFRKTLGRARKAAGH